VRITERDIDIIRWIDSFGYVTAEQVFREFGFSPKRGYRRLRLLVEEKYLLHRRIFFGRPGIYQAGGQGLALIADDPECVPGLAPVRAATMEHNLLLVDLAQLLVRKTGGAWKTDRQIRREKGFDLRAAVRPHVPDGILTLPGGKTIAVELELTAKGTQRLEKILKGYARAAEYREVWYFVRRPALAQKIGELTRKMPFVKTYLLEEVFRHGGESEPVTR